MLNPFDPQRDPGLSSYVNVQKRTLKSVQDAGVYDQIFQAVQNAFENALSRENILLTRPERQRLFAQTLKAVLEEMIQKLNERSKPDKE